VGMSTVKELEENLRALDPSEDASVIQEITTAIGSDFNYVWPSGHIDYAKSSDHVETHDRSY